jgi:hypothetical protein
LQLFRKTLKNERNFSKVFFSTKTNFVFSNVVLNILIYRLEGKTIFKPTRREKKKVALGAGVR